MSRPHPFAGVVVACLAALLITGYAVGAADAYGLRLLTLAGITAIAASGWQLIFGHLGVLSLAQGAFFGVGAYASALVTGAGYGFELALAVAAALSVLLAAIIAVPILRLDSHYVALATLGVAQLVHLLAVEWVSVTGGANGLAGIPPVELLGWPIPRGIGLCAFVWSIAALAVIISVMHRRGRHGAVGAMLRDAPLAAPSLGIDAHSVRRRAFFLSAGLAGIAGSLSAPVQRVVSPDVTDLPIMVTILAATIVGGRRHPLGPVVGALLLTHLPEWLRFSGQAYLLLQGTILLAVVLLAPIGLVPIMQRLIRSPSASTDGSSPRRHGRQASVVDHGPDPIRRPAPPQPAIRLSASDLSKSFGGVRALDGVSLTVHGGEIVGLIGPNGSGKTTLVNVLSGLVRADGGSITLMGGPLRPNESAAPRAQAPWSDGRGARGRAGTDPIDMARALSSLAPHRFARAGVARTFQAPTLPPDLGVLDAVALAVDGPSWARAKDHAREALGMVGLEHAQTELCASLSAAERRLVELARALAASPSVLLVDEPLVGLGDAAQMRVIGALRASASRGAAVLVVEHRVDRLFALADQVICLDQGRVIRAGPPEVVSADPDVRRAYLGQIPC